MHQYRIDISASETKAVVAAIGEDRLSTYRRHAPNDRSALDLYFLNTELSKHAYGLISGFEIALRNAVARSTSKHHAREDWYRARSFTRLLAPERRANIREVRRRLVTAGQEVRTGRIIAGLTFHFWVAMHENKYRDTIWTPHLHKI